MFDDNEAKHICVIFLGAATMVNQQVALMRQSAEAAVKITATQKSAFIDVIEQFKDASLLMKRAKLLNCDAEQTIEATEMVSIAAVGSFVPDMEDDVQKILDELPKPLELSPLKIIRGLS